MSTDLYQVVTDRILDQLAQGCVPWVKPWKAAPGSGMPYNASTLKPYRGINVCLLGYSGFNSNAWVTFKQSKDMGGHVRKGEHGSLIVFYKPFEVKDRNAPADDPDRTRLIPLLKCYTVFNVEQCEGLELPSAPTVTRPEPCAADAVLSQAVIHHGGDRAFYSPTHDMIQMPQPGTFRDTQSYYATALHELTHWSGHSARLAREYGKRFGDEAYAREELVAEMGAAFLCASLGIDGQLQHAEYLASWIKVLKGDKTAIVRAAGAAQKAADFLLGKQHTQSDDERVAA